MDTENDGIRGGGMSVCVLPVLERDNGTFAEATKLRERLRQIQDHTESKERALQRTWINDVNASFVLTEDHVKLLRRMRFQIYEDTDLVSVGADGKRPFGNGDWVEDIYEILDWKPEYDADGFTAATVERAQRIMAQLPLALNQIVKDWRSS
jgi:hypothetical protein